MSNEIARQKARAIGRITEIFLLGHYSKEQLHAMNSMPEQQLHNILQGVFPAENYMESRLIFGPAIAEFDIFKPTKRRLAVKYRELDQSYGVKIFPILNRVTVNDCELFLSKQRDIVLLGIEGTHLLYDSLGVHHLIPDSKTLLSFGKDDCGPLVPSYRKISTFRLSSHGTGGWSSIALDNAEWEEDYLLVCFYRKA